MPKLWARDNDALGLRLIHDWIQSLDTSHSIQTETGPTANSTQSALQDFHLFTTLDSKEAMQRAEAAIRVADPVTAGIYERFLPYSKKVARLGNQIDRANILAIEGHADAGRELFWNSSVHQCRTCHRLAGSGQMIGPDLDGIANKRNKLELLESIIDPSAKIEPEFATHAAVTVDGTIVSGLQVRRDSEKIVLKSADGQTHTLPLHDIEELTQQNVSLMPTGLASQMTAQELADLLAYLSELR